MNRTENRTFWQVYAIGLTLLLLGIFRMSLLQPYTVWDGLDIPLTLISLAGVYAYAFGWRLLWPWFWWVNLAAILLWDLVYNFWLRTFDHWGAESRLQVYGMLAVGFVFFLPEYVALYRYGQARGWPWVSSREVSDAS